MDSSPLIEQKLQNRLLSLRKILKNKKVKYESLKIKSDTINFKILENQIETFEDFFLNKDNPFNPYFSQYRSHELTHEIKNNLVSKFEEKNQLNEGWINGGYFIFRRISFELFKRFKYKNKIILETDILPLLSKKKELSAYKHSGFWKCIDTPRDKREFNQYLKSNKLPWMKF